MNNNQSKKTGSKKFGRLVFDATNIGENYPGITLPLTYSFVGNAYKEVYTHFLRLLGTSNDVVVRNQFALGHLLGYVKGHLYYNLTNWYRLLKLLPFYPLLKVYFNRMLTPVKSENDIDLEPSQVSRRSTLLFILYILFPFIRTRIFNSGFKQLWGEYKPKQWFTEPTVILLYRFEQLRDRFFALWANTIVNDFHVMVFWGFLVSLVNKAFIDPKQYLNTVVNADMIPESIEPLLALDRISQEISGRTEWQLLFQDEPEIIWQRISQDAGYSELKSSINQYLKHYGNRSGQELKLEVPKFSERPEQMIKLLQGYLKSPAKIRRHKRRSTPRPEVRQPLWLPLVWLVKTIAVRGIYRREKLRLMRGKAYGLAREVFIEIGRRFQEQGIILSADDIFYLHYHELESLCLYQTLPLEPQKLISKRRSQLTTYAKSKLTTRFVTANYNLAGTKFKPSPMTLPLKLQGTGTSLTRPVTAKVVVMEEFSVDEPVNGAILVTKKTDPGWTILFPLLKGIITETGGTLSHASIVARELGIPCITGVDHCTTILKTGDLITMDPSQGLITQES